MKTIPFMIGKSINYLILRNKKHLWKGIKDDLHKQKGISHTIFKNWKA